MTSGGMALGLMDTCMTLSRKDHQRKDQETIHGDLGQMDIFMILCVKIGSDEFVSLYLGNVDISLILYIMIWSD